MLPSPSHRRRNPSTVSAQPYRPHRRHRPRLRRPSRSPSCSPKRRLQGHRLRHRYQKKIDDLRSRKAPTSSAFLPRPRSSTARSRRASPPPPDFSQLLTQQDAILLCVPTPLTGHREPDLSYIENTAQSRRALAAKPGQTRHPREHHLSPEPPKTSSSPSSSPATALNLKVQTTGTPVYTKAELLLRRLLPRARGSQATPTVARRDIPKVVGGHDTHRHRARRRPLRRHLHPLRPRLHHPAWPR